MFVIWIHFVNEDYSAFFVMVRKKITLKDFLARVSVRVDKHGRKILFVEELRLRKKKKHE